VVSRPGKFTWNPPGSPAAKVALKSYILDLTTEEVPAPLALVEGMRPLHGEEEEDHGDQG